MSNGTTKEDMEGVQSPEEWWGSFRRVDDEKRFMISESGKDYCYFAPGENMWYRGQIGEKRGGGDLPSSTPTLKRQGATYDYSTSRRGAFKPVKSTRSLDILTTLFPDGDPEVLKECSELSFRELGVYMAQSAGFTWFPIKMQLVMTFYRVCDFCDAEIKEGDKYESYPNGDDKCGKCL